LATASDVTADAVRFALREEVHIALARRAVNFRQTMQMRYPKPDVLLMDLHLPRKINVTSAFVKGQLCSIPLIVLAIVNDAESRALAASYGAFALLDSITLHGQLVSTLMKLARHQFDKTSQALLVLPQQANADAVNPIPMRLGRAIPEPDSGPSATHFYVSAQLPQGNSHRDADCPVPDLTSNLDDEKLKLGGLRG
jgi:DNA-binding NarL/FixJ family response regulator